jgi:hypothetical protein
MSRRGWYATGAVAVVVLAAALTTVPRPSQAVFALVSPAMSPDEKPVPPSTVVALGRVSVAEMVSASDRKGLVITPPAALPVSAPVLASGGKPEVLYMCNEYDGSCADASWPLVMALEKFGAFHRLGYVMARSGPNAGTAGLDFYASSYSSTYVSFAGVEMFTAQRQGVGGWGVLQKPTAAESALLSDWDIPPYAAQVSATPFIDIGGRYYMASAGYSAQALDGLSPDPATALARTGEELAGGKSAVSAAVRDLAAHIVGAVCLVTANAPPACHGMPKALEKPGGPAAFKRAVTGGR